jgi:hypothetical protein
VKRAPWSWRHNGVTLVAFIILLLIGLLGKCKGQCLKVRIDYKGGIEVDRNTLAINTKKDHFILSVVKVDTIGLQTYYTLRGDNYRGHFVNSLGCYKLDVRFKNKKSITRIYWPRQ